MLENGTRDEAKLIFPIFFFFTYCKTHFYNIHFFPLTAPFYLNPYDTGRWCLKMGPEMKMNWSFPFSFSFHFFSLTNHHIISYTLHFQFTPSLFHFWHYLGAWVIVLAGFTPFCYSFPPFGCFCLSLFHFLASLPTHWLSLTRLPYPNPNLHLY